MKWFCSLLLTVFLAPILSATASAQVDSWPREYIGEKGGRLVVYQPQLESWDHYSHLIARVAGAVQPPGSKEPPVLGTFQLTGTTEVDQGARKVRVKNVQLSEINFPTLDPKLLPEFSKAVQEIIPKNDLVIALDRILANLERAPQTQTLELKNDPPPIYFSAKPAILVILDGEPIWSPIPGTDLKYAVNTNWDLFLETSTGTLFLRNEGSWLKARNIYEPWQAVDNLPASFQKLPPNNPNWTDVLAALPGKPILPERVPTVFVSTLPAEMIVTDGAPKFEMIPGTRLGWATNTDSNFFFDYGDRNYYYLVSGRWFRHSGLPGASWSFASASLPEDFKRIPEDHTKASVLASVPGTPDAEEAVIAANIPTKAKIKKNATAKVEYAGEPQFQPIAQTDLKYASNTQDQVLEYKGKYYLVKDGVWFTADNPKGPWNVTDQVPKEIYNIPPSSSMYNVTYVKVYESDDDEVEFGYTAGYMGAFVLGTAMGAALTYGSGWYYPPYYYGGVYYARPYSYGAAAYYNPWTGGYYGGARYYGPYGGVGYGAAYNPYTGTYARGAAAYGPYGGRAAAQAYNPYTNTYAQTRQGGNAYQSWGSSYVQQGDDWARTARYSHGDKALAGFQTSGGQSGFVAKGDDLYAGKNGNVYRKTDQGWQQYENGGWSNVDGKSSQLGQSSSAASAPRREPASQKAQAGGVRTMPSDRQKPAGQQWTKERSEAFSKSGEPASSAQRDTARAERAAQPRFNDTSQGLGGTLDRDAYARSRGDQRVTQFNSYQRSGGGRSYGGGGGGGGYRGGGRRR